MSRIGKKPVTVPDGVDVKVNDGAILVKGKHGELTLRFHPSMKVAYDSGKREIQVARPDDQRQNRALHGLTRALINNMVKGVVEPFEKKLEIVGVGFNALVEKDKANKDQNILQLQVGFANAVRLPVPQN